MDTGIVRQLNQGGFIVERSVPLDCLERQRAIHGPAFQIHVAQFAGQARGDGAFAIAADTVQEYAVVIAGEGKRLEAALHLAPAADEGGSARHLDVAVRV